MPCIGGPSAGEDENTIHGIPIGQFAVLCCGILTAIEKMSIPSRVTKGFINGNDVLQNIDWDECKVNKKKVLNWWFQHQEEDRRRKAAEAKARREDELYKTAVEKLTEEEFTALSRRFQKR